MRIKTRQLNGEERLIGISAKINQSLHERIKSYCNKQNISIALLMQTAIEAYLDEKENNHERL